MRDEREATSDERRATSDEGRAMMGEGSWKRDRGRGRGATSRTMVYVRLSLVMVFRGSRSLTHHSRYNRRVRIITIPLTPNSKCAIIVVKIYVFFR